MRAEGPMASLAQGKRSDTLGKMATQLCASKGKSVETEWIRYAFALAGRDVWVVWSTQGVASLALGYAQPWAFSPPWLIGMNRVSHDLDMRNLCKSERSVGDN